MQKGLWRSLIEMFLALKARTFILLKSKRLLIKDNSQTRFLMEKASLILVMDHFMVGNLKKEMPMEMEFLSLRMALIIEGISMNPNSMEKEKFIIKMKN